jgi:hypothetical protein
MKWCPWWQGLSGKFEYLFHFPVIYVFFLCLREISKSEDVEMEDKYGARQFRLPGSPFTVNTGKESATIGKIFAIRIFEEMNTLGYDLIASSDLSRAYDQSSW